MKHTLFLVCATLPLLLGADDCEDPDASIYYIDCDLGDDAQDGLSEGSPWGSFEPLEGLVLSPGDGIRLKRGTQCNGMFQALGSGTVDAPITLEPYGEGARPIINGEGEEQALLLLNQGGWHIRDLEIEGGGPNGIYIGSSQGTVSHIRLTDVLVHDVYAGEIENKGSGLVVLSVWGNGRYEDVILDGIEAYNTDQWAGIFFYGAPYGSRVEKSSGVIIRNSTVHDVYGDGIVLFGAQDSIIETSVAYRTGLQAEETIGTPNAIWTWYCDRCTVQYNEGYEAYSPGVDGGIYDIDWGTNDNIVQYNYGHDAQAYCVSVFGAEGETTTNALVRYNVCRDNGHTPLQHGDVYIYTWAGGAIDGVEILNNTFYWTPQGGDWPLLYDEANYVGNNPNRFANNIAYSTSNWMVRTEGELQFSNNLYFSALPGEGLFALGGFGSQVTWFEGLDAWQEAGRDDNSLWSDPQFLGDSGAEGLKIAPTSPAIDKGGAFDNQGPCDFWGNRLDDGAPDIGAQEVAGVPDPSCAP